MAMAVMPAASATRRMLTASAPSLSSRRRAAVAILRPVSRLAMYTVYTWRREGASVPGQRPGAVPCRLVGILQALELGIHGRGDGGRIRRGHRIRFSPGDRAIRYRDDLHYQARGRDLTVDTAVQHVVRVASLAELERRRGVRARHRLVQQAHASVMGYGDPAVYLRERGVGDLLRSRIVRRRAERNREQPCAGLGAASGPVGKLACDLRTEPGHVALFGAALIVGCDPLDPLLVCGRDPVAMAIRGATALREQDDEQPDVDQPADPAGHAHERNPRALQHPCHAPQPRAGPLSGFTLRERRVGVARQRGGAHRSLARFPGWRWAGLAGDEAAAQGLECRRRLAARHARPLDGEESVRDARPGLARIVDDHRQEKGVIIRHVEGALDCQAPLTAEVSFRPRLGLCRDHRHEEVALADLAADLLVPRVTAGQIALVVPDLETVPGQSVAEAQGGLAVLRGIAQKDGRCRMVRAGWGNSRH